MPSFQVFVTIESKKYRLALTSLTIANLKDQIPKEKEEHMLIRITSNDGHIVETDEQVRNAVEKDDANFIAYLQRAQVKEWDEKAIEGYEVKNPLVLLAGAMRYEQEPYVEAAKQDLKILQQLFESAFESLTLNELEALIAKHCNALADRDNQNKDMYDGLIFVWCGYGGFGSSGHTLITSDGQSKALQSIQAELAIKTDHLRGKPKIFISIVEKKKKNPDYGVDDTLTICVSIAQQSVLCNEKKEYELIGSNFTRLFCQIVEKNMNKSVGCIVRQVTEMVSEFVQTAWSISTDVYLIPKSLGHKNNPEMLCFKKHWNKNWRKANVEAAKVVEQMQGKNEQGLIIVANNTLQWQKMTAPNASNTGNDSNTFVALISSDQTEKRVFGDYILYVIKQMKIILMDIHIDGNVYAIDCEVQCQNNVIITTQLFVTKKAIIDPKLRQSMPLIQWDSKVHYEIPVQFQAIEDIVEVCGKKKLFNEAIQHLQKHLQIAVDKLGFNYPYVAVSCNLIGITYSSKGEHDKAIEFFEKALDVLTNIFGIKYAFVAQLYHNLGITYSDKRQHDKSIEYYKKALEIRLDVLGLNHVDVAWSYHNTGAVYFNKGEYDKAIEYYEKSLKIRLNIFGIKHSDVADSYNSLGIAYKNASQYDKSIECHEKSLKIRLEIFEGQHSDVARSYNNLGISYKNKGKYDEAIECHQKSLEIRKKIFGNAEKLVGDSNWNLAVAFGQKGQHETARRYYEDAWKVYSMSLGEWNEETIQAKENIKILNFMHIPKLYLIGSPCYICFDSNTLLKFEQTFG
ncbi:hypothetical protein RFI_31063 [Reticulomyxa filosa]|uniref:Uncharacterized protein n=1 Tax=Reticulomyxa filosa TaxID=46433 RepID=X6LYU9_RETFI|nr:hypothetical protein RFI_31063 [Reticulomyxa filosa]|eukprot:ETO06332.1 hypothetical protein RFI_31063 [Reticulomyxa filosa]